MTKFQLARIAAATAVVALSCSSAFAADTQTLTVNAVVPGVCKLSVAGPMAFALDPSIVAAATSNTVAATYKCTKNTSALVFAVGGSASGSYTSGTTAATGALAGGTSADLLQYSIGWTVPAAFLGTGFGAGSTGNTVNLTGTMAYAQFSNAAADTYTNTVPVTITP